MIVAISIVPISAKNLKEYRENISSVRAYVSAIIEFEGSEEKRQNIETKFFTRIPILLPEQDTVEYEGQTINIDNRWLTSKIKEYTETSENLAQRRNILNEIKERLDAIELKLDELQGITTVGQKKDSNKKKIGEILNREEYGKAKNEKSVIGQLLDRILKWFASLLPNPQISNKKTSGFGSVLYVFQILLYVLVIGAIGFVVYKFAPLFVKKFKRRKKESRAERIILGEKFAANETSENLFKEAEKLALEGNLKAAIRKAYISLLFELRERKIIGLAKHKTNRDYLREVRERKALFHNVQGLTVNYERHWYGVAPADQKDWEEFKTAYEKTLSQS